MDKANIGFVGHGRSSLLADWLEIKSENDSNMDINLVDEYINLSDGHMESILDKIKEMNKGNKIVMIGDGMDGCYISSLATNFVEAMGEHFVTAEQMDSFKNLIQSIKLDGYEGNVFVVDSTEVFLDKTGQCMLSDLVVLDTLPMPKFSLEDLAKGWGIKEDFFTETTERPLKKVKPWKKKRFYE